MKKTLGEQVAAFLAWRNWKAADLAADVQRRGGGVVRRQNIEGVLNGIEQPRYIVELAASMGTTVEMLRAGKYMPGAEAPDEPQPIDLDAHPDLVAIRKVKLRLQAGVNGFSVDPEPGDGAPIFFRADWLQERGYKPYNLVAVKVRGSSMEPNLYPDDTVVVNTADTDPRDGIVFAVNYEGEALIKRLIRDEGKWWIGSDNADRTRFPRKECREGSCIIVGRVIHKQSEQI